MASYLPPSLGSVFNKTPFIYGANFLSLQEAFKYFSPISVQNALTDFLINGFTIITSKNTNQITSESITLSQNDIPYTVLTSDSLTTNGIIVTLGNIGNIAISSGNLLINTSYSIQSFTFIISEDISDYTFSGGISPSQFYIYITGDSTTAYTMTKSSAPNIFWPVDVSLVTINRNTKWVLTVLCDNANYFFSFQQYA
jgi:hypothetical protein